MSKLKIESTITIPSGDSSVVIHHPDNKVDVYSKINSNYSKMSGSLNLGLWDELEFDSSEVVCLDNATGITSSSIIDILTVFVWTDGKSHRIAAVPDNSPVYSPTSVNRLYWATDTKKMYQNIADTWQMVGTLRHELMDNVGKYTHNEIDDKLDSIDTNLQSMKDILDKLENTTPDVGKYTHSNIDVILETICDNLGINISDLIET